jgi:ubiquinone/menaquinone biosynthesis C-methylase UbiE
MEAPVREAAMQKPDPAVVKANTAATFNLVAEGYDHPAARHFPYAADHLVYRVGPRPGQKVLDIAAGTGVVTVAAAQAVGRGGRVIAIDLSEKMLQQAGRTLSKYGIEHVDFHIMDAEALEFKSNYFDQTLCSFGLFFLPDMLKGLKDWVRVTKPGGKVAFTSFSPKSFQPMSAMLLDQLAEAGVALPADRSKMGWLRLANDDQGRALMSDAGLVDIEIEHKQLGFHLARADDWWVLVWNAGYRGLLEQLPPGSLDTVRTRHLEAVEKLRDADAIWLEVEVLFFIGRKPV